MTSTQPRVPSGVRAGGEFATPARAEPDVALVDLTIAARFVKPATCRRCGGSGVVERRPVYGGIPGGCYGCAGLGVIETDRATIAARKARAAARSDVGRAALERGFKAHSALIHLEMHEPARMDKAMASWQDGRRQAVLDALVAYYDQVVRPRASSGAERSSDAGGGAALSA